MDFTTASTSTISNMGTPTTTTNYWTALTNNAVDSSIMAYTSCLSLEDYKITIGEKEKDPKFIKVEILCPEKVMRFTFDDKTVIKTICDEEDDFDFEFAFFIALAKKMYGKEYTSRGIFTKACELEVQKKYIKIVKKGIKVFKAAEKAKVDEEKKKAEQKAIKARRHEKNMKRRAAARERRVNEMAEAIMIANQIENHI